MGNDHRFEARLKEGQPFLSPERDILCWFLGMCRKSVRMSELEMGDLPLEERRQELKDTLDAIKAYRDSIYFEDTESFVIAKRIWDSLAAHRGGRLFLANMAYCVLDMFIDASRRSVEQPELNTAAVEAGLGRDMILSKLDKETADKVKTLLQGVPGFGEFIPGMYEKTDKNGETINE